MDHELLEAIRQELNPIRQDNIAILSELSSMKQDIEIIKSEIAPMKQDIETIKSEIGPMKQDINKLKVLMEHDIPKQISLLAEGQKLILERLVRPDEVIKIASRVDILETVVKKHSADIKELKQA